MSNKRNAETDPSFGLVSISRVSGQKRLFESPFSHQHFIYRVPATCRNRKGNLPFRRLRSGCWTWTMARTGAGYGLMNRNNSLVYAHRFFYESIIGKIPHGMQIDHLCRNRACVNPAHMDLVTSAENSRRGLNTKLNKKDVQTIRELRGSGVKLREISKLFGIQLNHVHSICSKRYWKDV